jgi:signal transduction histidine kinase
VFFQLHRQRQQLMRELQDRTETLHLNEMFAAVLGHDLRTPLSALVTGAQLLQHQSADESVQRIATRMLSSGKRMTRMIEDLLDLTRARLAGGIPITRTRTDLGGLVGKVVQEQQANHPDRQIEVTQRGDLTGDWDPERLAQVTSNLIGNALVHGAGEAAVRVRLDGTALDAVSLSVANPGTIDPAVLPHLFDPFRGGERNGRQRGLGLGLYIAQQVIRAHEGTIDVRAAPGEDVVFSIKIPRVS